MPARSKPSKKDRVYPALTWPPPGESWNGVVLRLWLAAQINPHREFWEQSDVELLWANCQVHHLMLQNSLEISASMFDKVMTRYDALNLSLKGRIASGMSIESPEPVQIADESMTKMADTLKGVVMGLIPGVSDAK